MGLLKTGMVSLKIVQIFTGKACQQVKPVRYLPEASQTPIAWSKFDNLWK